MTISPLLCNYVYPPCLMTPALCPSPHLGVSGNNAVRQIVAHQADTHTKLGQLQSFGSTLLNIFKRKYFFLLNLVLKIKYLGAASSGELCGAELRPRGGRKSSLCFRRGPAARPRPRHQAAGGLKAARHKAAREREGRDPACVMSGRACVRARRVRVRNENVPLFLKVYLSWRQMQTFKLILLS